MTSTNSKEAWRKVQKGNMPQYGISVLCCDNPHYVGDVTHVWTDYLVTGTTWESEKKPKWWMPLPTPPAPEKSEYDIALEKATETHLADWKKQNPYAMMQDGWQEGYKRRVKMSFDAGIEFAKKNL